MQQSTSFDLDSIQLVVEMMEGGGNVTINGVEDGHRREGGGGRHNNYFEAQASECDEVTSLEQFVYTQ
jgi:hypothetical protein